MMHDSYMKIVLVMGNLKFNLIMFIIIYARAHIYIFNIFRFDKGIANNRDTVVAILFYSGPDLSYQPLQRVRILI